MANFKWEKEQTEFIKANAAKMKDQEMLKHINAMSDHKVTLAALRKYRARLGIKKQRGRGVCRVASVPRADAKKELIGVKANVEFNSDKPIEILESNVID